MRTNIFLSLVVTFLASLASAAQSDPSVDIFAWPLSAQKPQALSKISYNSTHATVQTYKIPKIPAGEELLRIGFYHTGDTWSGVATAASNFAPGKDKKVLLHLNSNGQLYHVGFKASEVPSSSKTGTAKDGLDVEVVQMQRGPTPHLNKPVVLNAEGKLDDQVVEKTFFQKYWWVIGGFLLLQVVMSTSGKE